MKRKRRRRRQRRRQGGRQSISAGGEYSGATSLLFTQAARGLGFGEGARDCSSGGGEGLSRGAGSTGPRVPARSSAGGACPGSPLGTTASAPPARGGGRWEGLLLQGGVGCSLLQAGWGAKRPPITRGSPGAPRGTPPWQEPQREWQQDKCMTSWGRLGTSTALSVGGPQGRQPQSRCGSTGQAMREMGVAPTATMRGEVPRCTLRDGRHVLRTPWGQWRK